MEKQCFPIFFQSTKLNFGLKISKNQKKKKIKILNIKFFYEISISNGMETSIWRLSFPCLYPCLSLLAAIFFSSELRPPLNMLLNKSKRPSSPSWSLTNTLCSQLNHNTNTSAILSFFSVLLFLCKLCNRNKENIQASTKKKFKFYDWRMMRRDGNKNEIS